MLRVSRFPALPTTQALARRIASAPSRPLPLLCAFLFFLLDSSASRRIDLTPRSPPHPIPDHRCPPLAPPRVCDALPLRSAQIHPYEGSLVEQR